MSDKLSVVFVCLGNICRSPLAEYVVADKAKKYGIADLFDFSSAGTGNWHIGGPADSRSAMIASRYGLDMQGHCAQQITANNWNQWQWFVAMDAQNRRDLLNMGVPAERIFMMRHAEAISGQIPDVPDPYYGGDNGFEHVFQMMDYNANAILDLILQKSRGG